MNFLCMPMYDNDEEEDMDRKIYADRKYEI